MPDRPTKRERRKQERMAREHAAAQAERGRRARRRLAAVVAAGALVVILVLAARTDRFHTLIAGFFGSAARPSPASAFQPVPVPAPRVRDLERAARAAGCELRSYPNFGRGHTTESVRYRTNPPTSGSHYPRPAGDGAYAPPNVPPVAQTVHSLEHGRVAFVWRPGLSPRPLGQLKSVFDEQSRHALMYENQTGMRFAVAAVAWRRLLGCPRFDVRVFDALRAFRTRFVDRGPERVS